MKWTQLKGELLRDPATRREYDALEAEYQLARSIIDRRMAKRMTQAQLAAKAGTKQPVISRLESGNTKPSLALLERVANALDARVVVRIEEKPATRKSPRNAS